jgi:outer membrane autotransporter protein
LASRTVAVTGLRFLFQFILDSCGRGTIITNYDYAYGMWAENGSIAENEYLITTSGNYAYGMYGTTGSQIYNLSSRAAISTSGQWAHGMFVEGDSQAWNSDSIATAGTDAYGMLAKTGSIIRNHERSSTGSIQTVGSRSHGMVADGNGSQAWNGGDISTEGDHAYGMWATNGASINNFSSYDFLGFIPVPLLGDIDTSGFGSHGMVAEGSGSIAANVGSIETSGVNALGMKASDLALAINLGGIETSGTGSVGLGAENVALAFNLGQIETGGEEAHGMQAQNLGLAVNMKGLPDLDGLDIIPLPDALLDILDEFGFFPGEIVTTGYGAHGMYAKDFSIAANLGDIFIRGDNPYAYGMLAEDFSLALNMGNIEVGEYGDENMGGFSHGMGARNWAAAINAGSITTYPYEDAYGMLAEDNSIVVNAGSLLSLGGDFLSGLIPGDPEDPEGDDLLSGIIDFVAGIFGGGSSTIETFGSGSHGMVARNSSIALNLDEIFTHGEGSYGMYAEDFSLAANFSSDSIETFGDWSHGMVASSNSVALNTGSILTHGDNSFGMLAENYSLLLNTGYIETFGDGAAGMVAEDNSLALNTGSIVTHGSYFQLGENDYNEAVGMYAANFSAALNFGTIETLGDGAPGMTAYTNSMAFNSGSIVTHDRYSYGMYGRYDSLLVNTGNIDTGTEGLPSEFAAIGMFAEDDSVALNFGEIATQGENSWGMYAVSDSLAANLSSDSIETWGDGAHGMVAFVNSMALNTGSITTHGGTAHGMYAAYNSAAINTGSILTSGFESYGINAEDSIVMNTGSIETEGTLSAGIFGVNSAILNTGSVKTSGATSTGILLWEGSVVNTGTVETSGSNSEALYAGEALAVNTGTLKATGENSAAAWIDENSLFINTGVLDSAQGNALTADGASSVVLLDGTVLAGSHTLEDVDGDSDLAVMMNGDIAAQVVNFGSLTKAGGGTLLVEGGSSVVGETLNTEGTLAVEAGTQFETQDFTQEEGANLYLFANPDSVTDLGAVPLWVNNHASISGSVYIDMSPAPLPGLYRYIRAETYDWDFDTYFVNVSPFYTPYDPQWLPGGSSLYTSFLGYSFSEAALGLVSAIDDWSMLRWVMANHLQDVADSINDMEVGETKIHARVLAGQTKRDPSGEFSAGFDSTQKGLSIGIDKKSSPDTVWGLYAGYTEKEMDFTSVPMAASDWENQDTWHLGGYISKRTGNWILSNTLTYRSTDHDTYRKQAGGDATAAFDSWAVTNDIRFGYVAKEIGEDSKWEIIPEVGLNVGYFERDGYSEKNGFTYGNFDTTVVESVLGIRLKGEYQKEDGSTFSPQFRLAWVHVLSGEGITIDQSWGGDTKWFTENLDDDYFVADIGMSLYNMNNMDVSLNYNGRYSDNSTSHGGWIRFQWEF